MSHPGADLSNRADGSKLCLECGLCCQGIFHGMARIQPDEIPAVHALGLRVVASEEGPGFPLPCPLHQDRCTKYEERPSPCSSYRCKLLRRYLEGAASWDESLTRIRETRELVSRLRRRLRAEDSAQGLWLRFRAFEDQGIADLLADREVLMDFVTLLTVSRQHFQNRAQPRQVLTAP